MPAPTSAPTTATLQPSPIRLDSVQDALAALRTGRPIVAVDDEGRENEGDFIVAAELATPEVMAFVVRYSSGMVCIPMLGADLDRLDIAMMTTSTNDPLRTAYTVTVDAAHGTTTGISAADRALAAVTLANARSVPTDLIQPGHVFPLRYREGGVLVRPGHTEAAVDLAVLAGLRPAGVISEICHDDGTMMRAPALRAFCDDHGLVMISIAQLIEHRLTQEPAARQVDRQAVTTLPTRYGTFAAYGYRATPVAAAPAVSQADVAAGSDPTAATEHLALVYGGAAGAIPAGAIPAGAIPAGAIPADDAAVLVRVHSECLSGDTFGSLRCDCGPQLDSALQQIVAEGRGVLIYLRGHEGRGIGLVEKLRAYSLQDTGRDTVDANTDLGLPVDARDYGDAAAILRDLGIGTVRLLTNNPDKVAQLERTGLVVAAREPLPSAPNPFNLAYLRTKRDRLGHRLPHDPPTESTQKGAC